LGRGSEAIRGNGRSTGKDQSPYAGENVRNGSTQKSKVDKWGGTGERPTGPCKKKPLRQNRETGKNALSVQKKNESGHGRDGVNWGDVGGEAETVSGTLIQRKVLSA